MSDVFPDSLIDLLSISVGFSFIIMALIQRVKKLSFIKKEIHVWICNFVCSFALAIPFGIHFYSSSIYDCLWIGLFTFVGAPTLYKTFKNQNIITYHPDALNDTITIPTSNEIKH